jgi:hypothetical protein
MNVVRLRCPRFGRILTQGTRQHATQRGPLAHSACPRCLLHVEGNAAYQIDAGDGHPDQRAARRVRPHHAAPIASAKRTLRTPPTHIANFMTRSPSVGGCNHRPKRGGHAREVDSERSIMRILTSRSVPAATAAAMLGKLTSDSSTVTPE